MQTTIARPVLLFLAAVGSVLGLCACDSASGGKIVGGSSSPAGSEAIAQHAPRMLVAGIERRRQLDRAVAKVRVGNPESAKVGAVLDELAPAVKQFDAGSHYLLAAASHLRDEGILNEDYDLADKLSIVIGNAAMVLWPVSGFERDGAGDEGAFVREFYDGAESDARTRALLVQALDVMREAIGELRNDDVLIVLGR